MKTRKSKKKVATIVVLEAGRPRRLSKSRRPKTGPEVHAAPSKPKVTPGSGNVFADLGLPDADELLAKSTLAIHIGRAIKGRGLTQTAAGEIMGIDQPKVSAIVRGRLDGFSSDRLLRFLNDLGHDVDIQVSGPKPEGRGRTVCS